MSAATQSIPKGYKQTEVGIIPLDWDMKPLGEFSQFRNGLNFVKSDQGDIVKMVGVADFRSNFMLSYDNIDSVQIAGSLNSDDLLRDGDLLFVRSNGNKALIGRCMVIEGLLESVGFSGFTIRGRISPEIALPLYVGRYFQTDQARQQIKEAGEGSHISNLSQQVLASLNLALPTLAEQEAIAAALSDADGLIESLESLIAKKGQIKHGTMQELLSGKRRLPGFSGKWETKQLGEIGEAVIGLTYKPSDVRESGVLVLRASNIFAGCLSYDDSVYVDMDLPERVFVQPGDILICVRNGSRDLIGKCAKIDESAQGMVFGAFMSVYRTPYHDYIHHQFRSDGMKRQIHEHLGATINQITNKSLNSFVVPFPADERERAAIASILSDMDAEIAALEAKLVKARKVKQGMMQELLTGRVRLV